MTVSRGYRKDWKPSRKVARVKDVNKLEEAFIKGFLKQAEQTKEQLEAPPTIHNKNVPGQYSITDDCVNCGFCCAIAPKNFKRDKKNDIVYVSKQPTTPEERELCIQAVNDCPVDAIRDNS
jgi:ferredoxin